MIDPRWSPLSEGRPPASGETRRAGRERGAIAALVENVRAGFRIALLRPVERDRFHANAEQIVLLGLLNGLLAFVWGWLVVAGGPVVLHLGGLGVQAAWILSVLFLAWLASREVAQDGGPIACAATVLLSPLFVGWLGYAAMALAYAHWPAFTTTVDAYGVYYAQVFAVWVAFVFRHALRVATGIPGFRATALAATYGIGLFLAFESLPTPYLWFQNDTPPPRPRPAPLDVESILHEQRTRVETAVAGLAPGRPGVPDLYFVGFGADARQEVFRREVETVRALMDRRFETRGRSLLLVNHRETLSEAPLATASNLADALEGLARRMDPAEDVLLLYLTGHGSRAHELDVRFPRFPLNAITPEQLGGMLSDAGIRWPVVIVSACYSGGYVDVLKSDRSLVMTSAAADRTSFGCSDDADMTWFGRAYFAEQLESSHDLAGAFEGARARVAEWEAERGFTASRPQMAVGDSMARRLRKLQTRLERLELAAASGQTAAVGAAR